MVITGIRHKLKSDVDERRTAKFTKYVMHYLRMFAILGIVFPILIGADYLLDPQTKNETVINKFYMVMNDIDHAEYHIYTNTYNFIANTSFYDHADIGDHVTYYYTPIFKTITDVSHKDGQNIYVCKPISIYGWLLIAVAITLILSTITMIKTRRGRRKFFKYDSLINLGVINAFFCLFTLVAILFHIPY